MSLPKLNVGDPLILRHIQSRYATDGEAVVTRLGRKWGYAEVHPYQREIKFDLETGHEDSGGYSAQRRVLTHEMDTEEKLRAAALDDLKSLGLRFDLGAERRFSTTVLENIARAAKGLS